MLLIGLQVPPLFFLPPGFSSSASTGTLTHTIKDSTARRPEPVVARPSCHSCPLGPLPLALLPVVATGAYKGASDSSSAHSFFLFRQLSYRYVSLVAIPSCSFCNLHTAAAAAAGLRTLIRFVSNHDYCLKYPYQAAGVAEPPLRQHCLE
jgi:hypothetical protein